MHIQKIPEFKGPGRTWMLRGLAVLVCSAGGMAAALKDTCREVLAWTAWRHLVVQARNLQYKASTN